MTKLYSMSCTTLDYGHVIAHKSMTGLTARPTARQCQCSSSSSQRAEPFNFETKRSNPTRAFMYGQYRSPPERRATIYTQSRQLRRRFHIWLWKEATRRPATDSLNIHPPQSHMVIRQDIVSDMDDSGTMLSFVLCSLT